jgi:hypothetical protein
MVPPFGWSRSNDSRGTPPAQRFPSRLTTFVRRIPVNAVITDAADSDRVWVACDVGVFESTDAGGSWSVLGVGLPNALAVDLLFYEPERLLRVGTRSRGVWEAAVG